MVYQWLIAAITMLIPAYAGFALMAYLRVAREKMITLILGVIAGLTMYGTATYALGYILPINSSLVIGELFVFFCGGTYLLYQNGFAAFKKMSLDTTALRLFIITIILFSIISPKLLTETSNGLYTGIINAYGDIGWHGSIIMSLAKQNSTLPLQDPIFAGEKLTYPFLVNLISATSVILGASLPASIDVPAILLIPCLLLLLYAVAQTYGGSKKAAIIACILFLFGGATLGWIRVFSDFTASNSSIWHFLLHLPMRDYSGVGTDTDGFHFLNPVTSLLLPQRAMLFGIPIVLSVLYLIHPKRMREEYTPVVAGILTGMLPLFHAHACIALAAAIIAIMITYPNRRFWIPFSIAALAIGIPELWFYASGSAAQGSFFRYGPGWMAGTKNPIIYWIQNTGIYIPLSIAALFLPAPKESKALVCAGTFLFIIADTFLFAPWEWDNFKLFVFWLIFILPIVSWQLYHVARAYRPAWSIPLVIAVIFLQTCAGILDITKLALPTATTWQEWDRSGMQIANSIESIVPPNAPVLTASVHNSAAVLAGRTLFLGYPAHIWSHGGSPWNREAEIKSYFSGSAQQIDGQEPQYVLVGPQERISFPSLLIRPTWSAVATAGQYTLYTTH